LLLATHLRGRFPEAFSSLSVLLVLHILLALVDFIHLSLDVSDHLVALPRHIVHG
jgi:hypothetical protein